MKKEIWKKIVNYPDYEVSSFGNVRSIDKLFERKHPNSKDKNKTQIIRLPGKLLKGYIRYKNNKPVCVLVNLRKNNKTFIERIHRLVLLTFDGKNPAKHVACHNDGNPLNNHIENLRWDTVQNNLADMVKHGTRKNPPISYGEKHFATTLTEKDVRYIRSHDYYHGLFADLARKYNVAKISISRIYYKKSWVNLKD